ncbi:MAG: AarF/ABC1/UbiB kinase family protein [Desulfobacterales bacterium]|jgi:ubiquinone biosynthesis protein|nr:AarF/ABC1/UbiB kinase family protein [Desulfobacterales bacterium]
MLSIRKIGVVSRTYRHLNRYRHILAVLLKHGFGEVVESLRIDQYLEVGLQLISKKRGPREEPLTRPQRLRKALEELGPTYIKLGQVLSTRPDLIPVEFTEELSKLQDSVPPFSFADAETIIQRELGAPASDVFDRIDTEPAASASIGQVHRARLKNGEEAAVKIQRPGIRAVIEVDLEIMLHLATLAERHVEELALHKPVTIVEEFARTLEKEIDFRIEAANIDRVAQSFLGDPAVYIPAVFREFSSAAVLTTEYVEGIKISNIGELDAAGYDRRLLCSRGADIVLKQVFHHGFFHADPHPGNIFALPGNVICLLDFGMVGVVDRQTREMFVELVDSVVRRNESRAAQVLLQLTRWEQPPDLRQLERELSDFMGRHLYRPLKDIEVGKLLHDLLEIATRFHLQLPPDIFLMLKAISTVEAVGRMLDPEFDMIAKAAPFIEQVLMDRFKPQRVAEDVGDLAARMLKFLHQFPKDLLDLAGLLRQQKLSLQIKHDGLEKVLATHDQISNRLSFSIVIAALIVGSALIVISKTPPLFYGISLIGIIGFLAAALMGIWLLVAILRSGRL